MQKYAPAVLLASFACGVAAGAQTDIPIWAWCVLTVCALAFGLAVFRSGKGLNGSYKSVPFLVLAVFSAGGWREASKDAATSKALSALPWYGHVNYTAVADEVPGINRGQEVRFIKIRNFKSPQAPAFPSGMRLSVPADTSLAIKPGDVLCGEGTILPLKAPQRHDTPDFSRINILKGIVAEIRGGNIFCTGKNTMSLSSLRENIRTKIKGNLIRAGLSRQSASLTCALVLGDKNSLDKDTKQAYQLSGAMHLLVVSGLHVGIVAALLYFLSSPLKKRKMLRAAVILVSLWAYGWLTGYSPPVLRALWMFSILTLSGLGGGRYSPVGALGVAGLSDLVFFPNDLFSAGFQMSYAATLAIILLYGKISKLCATLPRGADMTAKLILVSLAAQTALLPFVLYYFDYLNFLFPLTNLLLVPLVCYLLIPAGILMIVLSAFTSCIPVLPQVYDSLTGLSARVASGIAERDFAAVTDLGLSQGAFYGLIPICAGAVFFFRRKTAGACLAVTGGIIWASVTLISGNPFPYLGQEGEKYFVYLDEDRKALPSPGSIITAAGHTVCFMPGKTDSLPDGKFILAAEKYRIPYKAPAGIIVLPGARAEDVLAWKAYAATYGAAFYDMRAQGYYKFAKD